MENSSLGIQEPDAMLSGQTTESTAPFQIRSVVEVMPRLWPGMNKQGGTARIMGFQFDAGVYLLYFNIWRAFHLIRWFY